MASFLVTQPPPPNQASSPTQSRAANPTGGKPAQKTTHSSQPDTQEDAWSSHGGPGHTALPSEGSELLEAPTFPLRGYFSEAGECNKPIRHTEIKLVWQNEATEEYV